MLANYFLIIRNYVLSVSSQRKYNFYHRKTLLDAFRMNIRNVIGRNPSMVIPLLGNQDVTPMLVRVIIEEEMFLESMKGEVAIKFSRMETEQPALSYPVNQSIKQPQLLTNELGRYFEIKMHLLTGSSRVAGKKSHLI